MERVYRDLTQTCSNKHVSGCRCSELESHYGGGLHKCIFLSCRFRRLGFLSLRECREHIKNHKRPYKCPVRNCPFATLGFLSSNDLWDHGEQLHSKENLAAKVDISIPRKSEELYPLLFDLVATGNLDVLKRIWTKRKLQLPNPITTALIITAASTGSYPITRLILEHTEIDNYSYRFVGIASAAIRSENAELLRYIFNKTGVKEVCRFDDYQRLIILVLNSASSEVFTIWKDSLEVLFDQNLMLYEERRASCPSEPEDLMMNAHSRFSALLFGSKRIFAAAKRNPEREAQLLETWKMLAREGKLNEIWLGNALIQVAQETCSIPQAQALLEAGADINQRSLVFRRAGNKSKAGRGRTALHWASRDTSEDAAHFMKFLLERGADPSLQFKRVGPADEEGARNISRWLDITWEELVESTSRLHSTGTEESRDGDSTATG